MKKFCLKCNSDLHFIYPVCAVCSSRINFNLNIPSNVSSISIESQNLQSSEDSMENYEKVMEETIEQMNEIKMELNTYRISECLTEQKRSNFKLQDLLKEPKPKNLDR